MNTGKEPEVPTPDECKAVLPSVPVQLRLIGKIYGDSVHVRATFADGKELTFVCHANFPEEYGVFFVVLEDGSPLMCDEPHVVASLASYIHAARIHPSGTIADDIPVLNDDGVTRTVNDLHLPSTTDRLRKHCEEMPEWPLGLWL